jgi:putative ABC transport system ATP-binding protein
MSAIALPRDAAPTAAPTAGSGADGVVVSATGLVRRYGEGATAVEALRGISLDVAEARMTAIMGPSGSGKSTLMHLLAGLDDPTEGSIVLAGTEIVGLGERKLTLLRRQTIGFVFQFFNLLPMLTAEENITLPLSIAGRKPDPVWLEELLDTVGIADRRGHRPAELSGGQQQRVAVARALITRPKVLFADEPTGNLDSRSSKEVLALLRRAVDDWGQTIVMVSHDAGAAAMADRILFLADGRIVRDLEESTAAEVLAAMQEVSSR